MDRRIMTGAMAMAFALALPATAGAQDTTRHDEMKPHHDKQEMALEHVESGIRISGTVTEVDHPESFVLDYGTGTIKVESDELDWSEKGTEKRLERGEKVTVAGRIDDDFFGSATLEASGLFTETDREHVRSKNEEMNKREMAYENRNDEWARENREDEWTREDKKAFEMSQPFQEARVVVSGTVTALDGEELTLSTGTQSLTVETDELDLEEDLEESKRIQVGDRLTVTGEIDDDFFEGRELVAKKIDVAPKSQDRTGGTL